MTKLSHEEKYYLLKMVEDRFGELSEDRIFFKQQLKRARDKKMREVVKKNLNRVLKEIKMVKTIKDVLEH